jgi:hypothetical protein
MKNRLEKLVAEEDPNDAFLLRRAFIKGGVKAPVHFVQDGQEAIDYLSTEVVSNSTAAASSPTLLLLDPEWPENSRVLANGVSTP